MEPANSGPVEENRNGPIERRRDCRLYRRCGEGERRSNLVVQGHADLATVFRNSRTKRSRGVVEARGRPAATAQIKPVMVPTEQQRLEQDRSDADQRNATARRHSRPAAAHGRGNAQPAGHAPNATRLPERYASYLRIAKQEWMLATEAVEKRVIRG